jgi:hypothetical protein
MEFIGTEEEPRTSTGLYFGYGTENDKLQCKTAFLILKRTIRPGKSKEFVTEITYNAKRFLL